MSILQKVVLVGALATSVQVAESKSSDPDLWSRILSLMEEGTAEGNPQLAEHLQTLTAEQMLLAARQACQDVARRSGEMRDMPPEAVAELYVMACLHYYFDKIALDPGAQKLLAIVRDTEESPFLRSGILACMGHSPETRSEQMLQRYVEAHGPGVDATLTKVLQDRSDHVVVRTEAMNTLTWILEQQALKITLADANRHAIWEQTHKPVPVGKLMRSGELTLTEETLKALEPLEVRAAKYVKLLGAILADEENEPDHLRKRAKWALERRYKHLPFPDLDEEIDKALEEAKD